MNLAGMSEHVRYLAQCQVSIYSRVWSCEVFRYDISSNTFGQVSRRRTWPTDIMN